ncbi:MAG: hypothetical protein ACRDRJ_03670 [Streptosporangiaceae bacterium]
MPAATPLPRSPSIVTLYSAADLLRAPGCPVCQYAAEASDRYLIWMALEGHAQMTTITRLCASLGTCAAHTRRLAGQPGAAIRLTAVYRYIVTAALGLLTTRAGRLTPCMACEHDEAAAGRALETLLDDLADEAVRSRYRDLGGLCLPHLNAAVETGRRRDSSWLTRTMQETITAGAFHGWLAGADADAENRAVLRVVLPPAGAQLPSACPPCLAGAQAERDALECLPGLADDTYETPGILCAGHLADAVTAADPDAARALLTCQVQCITARLLARPARLARARLHRADPDGQCLVCRARRGAAQRALSGLRTGQQAPEAGTWLCVRHLLVLRARDQRASRALTRTGVERADELIREFIDASERAAEALGHGAAPPASKAWHRAAAFVDGTVFGGMPPDGLAWHRPVSREPLQPVRQSRPAAARRPGSRPASGA